MEEKREGMLSPYRVLDLTDEKGLFCGKLLGDLGADVIKIERPGGDAARNIGPFYHDEVDPQKSLFWFAFSSSKRGITLNIEKTKGQEIFKGLVETADFVIESFPPGYLDKLGLGYPALEKVKPTIIMVSVTPFGQTGPYRDYKAPDIVAWAMGSYMYGCGDADRPPIRIGYPQAYLQAGAEAATAALVSLYHRQATGQGQQAVVSAQASVAQCAAISIIQWDTLKRVSKRGGREVMGTDLRLRSWWPCKDGDVYFRLSSGHMSPRNNPPLGEWMANEGMADDYFKGFDWNNFGFRRTPQEVVDSLEERIGRFFMTHTKAELFQGGMKYRLMVYPRGNTGDVLKDAQLTYRNYWVEVEHPELGATITYPGAFVKASETPPRISRRAPLIGEHNQEVYEQELGISKKEIQALKRGKVI